MNAPGSVASSDRRSWLESSRVPAGSLACRAIACSPVAGEESGTRISRAVAGSRNSCNAVRLEDRPSRRTWTSRTCWPGSARRSREGNASAALGSSCRDERRDLGSQCQCHPLAPDAWWSRLWSFHAGFARRVTGARGPSARCRRALRLGLVQASRSADEDLLEVVSLTAVVRHRRADGVDVGCRRGLSRRPRLRTDRATGPADAGRLAGLEHLLERVWRPVRRSAAWARDPFSRQSASVAGSHAHVRCCRLRGTQPPSHGRGVTLELAEDGRDREG